MRNNSFWAVLILLVVADASAATLPVASSGETVLTAEIEHEMIHLVIKTRIVEIGKPSDPWTESKDTSCTYSHFPCSLVDSITLSVGGHSIPVPRSAFADLSDLIDYSVSSKKHLFTLRLHGGDASEAYTAEIKWNKSRVLSRKILTGDSPARPLEETVYFFVED